MVPAGATFLMTMPEAGLSVGVRMGCLESQTGNAVCAYQGNTNRKICSEHSPCESTTTLFGRNSNWRGPIWFPINYLLIESLEKYYEFYGNSLLLEFPTNSGKMMNLKEISVELASRLVRIFIPDDKGKRPCNGEENLYMENPDWRELVLFYEYFHGDTGRGCGASHQTGWTALVSKLIEKTSKR